MKVVIFDLNGTLVDSRDGFVWRFQRLTEEFDGKPAQRHEIMAKAYGRTNDVIRALVQNTDVPFQDIRNRYDELGAEAGKLIKLYDGVDELLPILESMGVALAAVSSNSQKTVEFLQQAGVHHHFKTIITGDQVSARKPDPEGVNLALKTLGAEPEDAVMVGDRVVDILAGRNAGVGKVVGVTHGYGQTPALRAAGVDHLIRDIPSLLDVLE